MLRRLTNSFDSFNGGLRVAHFAITVPIRVIGESRYEDKDLPQGR
jgi:hypothetical protein